MRLPKLLQPSPATETSRLPIIRVCTRLPPLLLAPTVRPPFGTDPPPLGEGAETPGRAGLIVSWGVLYARLMRRCLRYDQAVSRGPASDGSRADTGPGRLA